MTTTQGTTLPQLLTEARGDRSYKQAADDLGITDRMYKQWETGYARPGPDRADMIAEFTGVHRADILAMLGVIWPEEAELLKSHDAKGGGSSSHSTWNVQRATHLREHDLPRPTSALAEAPVAA